MGDRAMAEIKVKDGSLYFYTHSYGFKLYEMGKNALKKASGRIGDDAYALKIVVDSLINESESRDCEIGAGLMLGPDAEDKYNNDNPSVIIDLVKNRVVSKAVER